MIELSDKAACTGCEGCAQCCPASCITMQPDGEGFLYPPVDAAACVACGLCERVCPVLHPSAPRQPLSVHAACNRDAVLRLGSSSGGVFSALACRVLGRGGVVFGARFDADWNVVHGWTDSVEGLAAFRKAKYAQSRVGTAYRDVQRFLAAGRDVLFSGTPCQVAGLKRFLHRDYARLLTVDVVCHGVPSPGIWQEYLHEAAVRHGGRVTSVDFRDKSTGWAGYSLALTFSPPGKDGAPGGVLREGTQENTFMRGFLNDLYLRPSCHACPAKPLKGGSDVTLGDFWDVEEVKPHLDDDRGVSAVMVNTEKGRAAWTDILPELVVEEADYADVVRGNPALCASAPEKYREAFFRRRARVGMSAAVVEVLRRAGRVGRLLSAVRGLVPRFRRRRPDKYE